MTVTKRACARTAGRGRRPSIAGWRHADRASRGPGGRESTSADTPTGRVLNFVIYPPDWSSMDRASLDAFTRATVAGRGLYFYGNASDP